MASLCFHHMQIPQLQNRLKKAFNKVPFATFSYL